MLQQASAYTLEVDDHVLHVECDADGLTIDTPDEVAYDLRYKQTELLQTIYLIPPTTDDEVAKATDIVSFNKVEHDELEDTLHLYHLEVPRDLRGRGFGKLALAFQYLLCTLGNHEYFSIKFADADQHIPYLSHLGFPDIYIDSVQDADHDLPSAVVGDVERVGTRSFDWILDPIERHHFPTRFFDIRPADAPLA